LFPRSPWECITQRSGVLLDVTPERWNDNESLTLWALILYQSTRNFEDPAFRRHSIDRPAVGRFDGNCTNTQLVPSFVFLISIDFDGGSISRTDLYVKEILTTSKIKSVDMMAG